MWKLESDEGYFRIYNSKKLIAGYFDPDYGDIFHKITLKKLFMSKMKYDWHSIRISHTDQDMLTIAFQIKFLKPTPLENKALPE